VARATARTSMRATCSPASTCRPCPGPPVER
jgi:hypothetical protein